MNQTHSSHFDRGLMICIALLSIWGAIMVYSGSVLVAVKQDKNPYHFFMLQLIWLTIGSIGGYILFKMDYHKIIKLSPYALAAVFVLLIAVLVINIQNDIRRWIPIGPFTLQPSELAKLVFVTYLSGWLAKFKSGSGSLQTLFKRHFVHELLPFCGLLAVIALPIVIQPDLDTTVILAGASFITYFVAGTDRIHFLTSVALLVILALVGLGLIQAAGYRADRLASWWEFTSSGEFSEEYEFGRDYQLRQILTAVGSGQFFGVGFGESRQKFHYLGETAFTDTVFAIYAEEFGFVGSVILVGVYTYIALRGYKIAREAPDKQGFLLATAITSWLSLQAFMHIASNVALIPLNGNTLPFMSYGGSATLANILAISLLLNISKNVTREKALPQRRRINK